MCRTLTQLAQFPSQFSPSITAQSKILKNMQFVFKETEVGVWMQRVLTLDIPEDVGSKERHDENGDGKGIVGKDLSLASGQKWPKQKQGKNKVPYYITVRNGVSENRNKTLPFSMKLSRVPCGRMNVTR